MITKKDITLILAEAYKRAAREEKCDMRLAADLFETVRENIDLSDPYLAWEFIILDGLKYDNPQTLPLLLDLREAYYLLFFERTLTWLDDKYKADKKEGLKEWNRVYSEAAVHFRNDLLSMLCFMKEQWGETDTMNSRYSKLPRLIRENRWPDTWPFFTEIAANENLTTDTRAYAEMALTEIILYYFHEYSGAAGHLEKSRQLLPGHFLNRRTEAVLDLKTGNMQKARDGFMQVLAMNPADYCSVYFIGDCFMAEEKLESAEFWYKEAIRKNCLPTTSLTRLLNLYGHKAWLRDKESLVQALIEKIGTRKEIRNPRILVEKNLATEDCFTDLEIYQCYIDMASNWMGISEYDKAEEWLIRARDLQPGIVPAILNQAYVKQDRKQPEQAMDYFQQALGIDPDCFEAHLGLALFYKDSGNRDEALRYFNECLRLRPERADWVNNFIGNLYYSCEQYQESEGYYRKAVELNGSYPVYRENLAGAIQARADRLAGESKDQEAENLYHEAVAIDEDADRWNSTGNFYYKLEKWDQAAGCYEKAVRLRDSDPVLHENLGLALQNMGKLEEAEKSYLQAISRDEVSGRYFNRLGLLYYGRNQFKEALELFGRAAGREPGTAVYVTNMASASGMLREYDQALRHYQEALKIDPNNYLTYNDIGIVFYQMGKNDEAIESYSKAIQMKPDDAVLYLNIALALDAQGRTKEASEVTLHPMLNEETRKQLEELLKQYLPSIFNLQ
jgi:tetratricopeptide (TPR) repeat protein